MTKPTPRGRRYAQSLALYDRARKTIPGGIYGHTDPSLLAKGEGPFYFATAQGCRYWDVDGNEFLDLLSGYGPMILGYRHPEVEEAAERQRRLGDVGNHPAPVMVELAERLVGLIDFADWALFAKNGSDATTWAVRIAREHTQRRKLLLVEDSYHGVGTWCAPGPGGLIREDQAHVHRFLWDDVAGFDALMARHADDVAGVVVTPFHHPFGRDSEMPAAGFLQHLQTRAAQAGSVLILDDIRAGFRLHSGGSHRCFDFEPDLSCYSKALANGYALAAVVGRSELKDAANRVFATGSFWGGAVAMAAALATLDVLAREDAPARLARAGERLCRGMSESARHHGLRVTVSGPSALPLVRFPNHPEQGRDFAIACLDRGLFLHPSHNWFLNLAHSDSAIDEALDVMDEAFRSLTGRPG